MAEIAAEPRPATWSGRLEAFSTDFRQIAATGEYGPMHGVIGPFASYRRDPLLGTYREGGAGDHGRAVG